ncbi:alpha/beta fold hydrolase [Cellulomonas endometrii]|uniref:alpha/beta fold hydrolase n=1 Tax=Cellulomonas endometrii TaxID=3036301 RepID=UPI0024ACA1FA|nr:alpha/beta hydrolase [Cellulomonas endometrii]
MSVLRGARSDDRRAPGRWLARTVGGARPRGLDPAAGVVVTDAGDPGAPAVVLVHGIGVSERYFRPLTAELARDRRVLVPDLPGFGRSPKPERVPTVEDLADVVLAVLRHRGVDRAVLVGHSMGAQVVAEAMLRAPEVVERVLMIGSVVDAAAPTVLRQAGRLARDGLHEPPGVNAIVLTDYLRAGPRWYSAVLPHMFAYDTAAAVARLPGPALLVRGADDPVASREWVRELARLAPRGAVREVPHAGHIPMATHAPLVGRWVRDGVPELRDDVPELREGVPELRGDAR